MFTQRTVHNANISLRSSGSCSVEESVVNAFLSIKTLHLSQKHFKEEFKKINVRFFTILVCLLENSLKFSFPKTYAAEIATNVAESAKAIHLP